ncbi:MAG: metalloregulator ArsR/SmtB family transcription factor [Anaerolineae bacterium]
MMTYHNVPAEINKTCCASEVEAANVDYDMLAEALQMLAHPIRLKIVAMLAAAPDALCACDIEAALPIKQPTVSHHLKLLRAGGIISAEKRGQFVYYQLRHQSVAAHLQQVMHLLRL